MSNSNDAIEFQLSSEYIELIKLLKLLNLVESGADAKLAIEAGEVTCNGTVELRKRKKLISGDVVSFDDQEIKIL
ncbi:MAG: RNA-binding S4 domain-containing protein [Flavobacteriales bacterium]|nr:RNA-binding S4 domain-containing protein [Flavobacteriales bacterium]